MSREVELTLTTTVEVSDEQWESIKAVAKQYECSGEDAFFEVMHGEVAAAIRDADYVEADFLFDWEEAK